MTRNTDNLPINIAEFPQKLEQGQINSFPFHTIFSRPRILLEDSLPLLPQFSRLLTFVMFSFKHA